MQDLDEKIRELEGRIERLVRTQIGFQTEISDLRVELRKLRRVDDVPKARPQPAPTQPSRPNFPPGWSRPPARSDQRPAEQGDPREDPRPVFSPRPEPQPDAVSAWFLKYTESARADLEKFIGENLISKIGILVLIIGIGIGVKYSIDNDLISPLTRVILAYLLAFGLVGLAIKLKPKYLNFSSVLISGGMATMYFVTYFGFAAYGLIDRYAAFGLMAACTIFTVVAALFYNRQVIAHIGLVGAYAVPFLLSEDSGNYLALFSYMAIINAGILAVSIKKFWRPIFYTASAFTWLIFFGWFAARYLPEEHLGLALTFLGIFFGLFFATKLVHAIVHKEHDSVEGVAAISVTVLIFYAFCFGLGVRPLSLMQVWAFFIYLALATMVLAALSLKFVGKITVILAFGCTWLIFGAWYIDIYSLDQHFVPALVFASVIFGIFYLAALAFRLTDPEFSLVENSALVLTNSFVFYGSGYAVLNGNESTAGILGLYTAGHAAFHFAVASIVGRIRPTTPDVVQVLTILVLTFASLAIPVQLDGNHVTMAWSIEAALLFWFGRGRTVRLFEIYSYPVMVLATASMFFDWGTTYIDRVFSSGQSGHRLFANGNFVTALVYIAAFAVIFGISRDKGSQLRIGEDWSRRFRYAVAALAIFVLYNAFRIEIANYFHGQLVDLADDAGRRAASIIRNKSSAWQANYTMAFLSVMALINRLKVRSFTLAAANAALGVLTLAAFATAGMVVFYDLRVAYMAGHGDHSLVSIRYLSYVCAALLTAVLYLYSRDEFFTERVPPWITRVSFEAVSYGFWFIAASCELVNSMAQIGLADGTKLGLSIFWGIYALMLVIIGIARNRKHLRVAAIGLLGVTLLKLFFYDVADLDTIPRTILFVSLGLTLLVVSFLYNKYKNAIFGFSGESEEES